MQKNAIFYLSTRVYAVMFKLIPKLLHIKEESAQLLLRVCTDFT